MSELTKTLVLSIALPDFYAEDLGEEADGFYDGDVMAALFEETGMLSLTARFFNLTGSKEGNELQDSRAVIVGAAVVERKPDHDEPEDERLMEELGRRP